MKKNIIFIILIIVIAIIGTLFLSTGRVRTDVFLSHFEISDNSEILTLKVGVSSSSGYIRKMKNKQGGDNYYLTFYSTFGINSNIGAKNTFNLEVNPNATEIYFYTGNGDYQKVLQKDPTTGEWLTVASFTSSTVVSVNKK